MPQDEKLANEFGQVGCFLCDHPIDALAAKTNRRTISLANLKDTDLNVGRNATVAVHVSKVLETVTKKKTPKFVAWVSDASGISELCGYSRSVPGLVAGVKAGQCDQMDVSVEDKNGQR